MLGEYSGKVWTKSSEKFWENQFWFFLLLKIDFASVDFFQIVRNNLKRFSSLKLIKPYNLSA